MATRHADQYTKGEIDIDALPDSDSADEMTTLPPTAQMAATAGNSSNSSNNLLALAGLGLTGGQPLLQQQSQLDEQAQLSNVISNLLAAGGAPFGTHDLNQSTSSIGSAEASGDIGSQMRQLCEGFPNQLRKYIEGLADSGGLDANSLSGLTDFNGLANNNNNLEPKKEANGLPRAETPLDLTKPIDLS